MHIQSGMNTFKKGIQTPCQSSQHNWECVVMPQFMLPDGEQEETRCPHWSWSKKHQRNIPSTWVAPYCVVTLAESPKIPRGIIEWVWGFLAHSSPKVEWWFQYCWMCSGGILSFAFSKRKWMTACGYIMGKSSILYFVTPSLKSSYFTGMRIFSTASEHCTSLAKKNQTRTNSCTVRNYDWTNRFISSQGTSPKNIYAQ